MRVHTTRARSGDRARLFSPYIESDYDACLRLDHLVDRGSVLDLFIEHINPNTSKRQQPEVLCRLGGRQDTWNTSYIYLPSGYYRLLYEAITGSSETEIKIDNVTLLNENCTFDIIEIESMFIS